MGYNGPPPAGRKPAASPAPPPPPRGKGPLGRSGVNPSNTVHRSYRSEFLGQEPPRRGFWSGLLLGLFLDSD